MWKRSKLGTYCTFQEGYVNPSQKFPGYFDGNVKWIRAVDLNNSYVYDTSRTLSELGFMSAGKSALLFEPNTIVISKSGTIGRLGIIKDYMCGNRATINIKPKNNADLFFVFYLLLANQERIADLAVGSVQRNLYVSILENLEFDFPDLLEQQRIGAFLSTFTDKIENNNLINQNLEEQALALFRHYFMDFVPYGGAVPSEWTEVSLDDVCIRITDGSHYSPADAPGSPYPMYSVKDMETYGFNPSSCKHITEEDFRKMQKADCVPLVNDILVAKDGSYLKEIFICSENKEEAILSSIAIFRPDTNIILPEILLYLLKQPSVRKDVGDNYVSGSALPRIVLKDFKKYQFMLPPMDEQLKICSILHAIRMQTKANIEEIQCLSSSRDTLLPKLMSGEIDVSEIDI